MSTLNYISKDNSSVLSVCLQPLFVKRYDVYLQAFIPQLVSTVFRYFTMPNAYKDGCCFCFVFWHTSFSSWYVCISQCQTLSTNVVIVVVVGGVAVVFGTQVSAPGMSVSHSVYTLTKIFFFSHKSLNSWYVCISQCQTITKKGLAHRSQLLGCLYLTVPNAYKDFI